MMLDPHEAKQAVRDFYTENTDKSAQKGHKKAKKAQIIIDMDGELAQEGIPMIKEKL